MIRTVEYLLLLVLVVKEYSTAPTVEPRFREVETNITVTVGRTAKLPCSIINQPFDTRVAWIDEQSMVLSLNERPIADDERISVERPYWGEWYLLIHDTQQSDQGTYFCLISTTPILSKRFYLTVVSWTTTELPTEMEQPETTTQTELPDTTTQIEDNGGGSSTTMLGYMDDDERATTLRVSRADHKFFPVTSNTPTADTGTSTSNTPTADTGTSTSNTPTADTGTNTSNTPTADTGTATSNTPTADTDTATSNTPTADTGTSTSNTPTADTGTVTENIHDPDDEPLSYGEDITASHGTATDSPSSDNTDGYSTNHPEAGKDRCSPEPADLVFLLDASNSIWLPDFHRQKLFVERVVRTFDVGPGQNQTRVGALTFGHGVWPKFYLHTYSDIPTYVSAIRRIRHGRGNRTNTGDALVFTRDVMFSERAGSRKDVRKIAVILSDGRSQATVFTQETAVDLQNSGITLFAVSVGFRLDHKELATIASDPDHRYYFSIDDYSDLHSIKDRMRKEICGEPEALTQMENTPSDQDPSTQVCQNKIADINFMVDSSYSITKENFAKEMEFIHSVIAVLDIGANKTRVGVMSFSDSSQFHIKLDMSMSKGEYQLRLNSVTYMGGGTDTAKALRRMREDGFVSNSGEIRDAASRIIIVLTDGLSLTPDVTAREADMARMSGIQIFSIGIGNGVDKRELADIASKPTDKYVLHVNDFWALDDIQKKLAIRACMVEPMAAYLRDAIPTSVCAPIRATDLLFVYDAMALGGWRSQTISQFLAQSLKDVDLMSGRLRVGRDVENCVNGNIPLGSALQATDLSTVRYSTFDKMLDRVNRIGFSVENGGRENSSKMAVIFLDEDMRVDLSTLQAAKRLKNSVDFFYVIAIGHNMRMMRLAELAGDGSFINIDSYQDLFGMADKLQGDMCDFFFTNAR